MRYLDFSSNFITTFPGAMMRRLNFLTRLIFRKNSIQKLQRDAFEGLSNLELIDFHDNRIQDIDNRAFKDLRSLKSLDLSLNVISTVGSSLEPLTNLMKLNLSDNYITSLPRNAFHSLRDHSHTMTAKLLDFYTPSLSLSHSRNLFILWSAFGVP